MADRIYVLYDGRAATDVDSAMVLDTGGAQECCELANEGLYGTDCFVGDDQGNVMWEWRGTDGVWGCLGKNQ